ncbi:MAG: nucleoside triphosphate pyrophosphohydrolase [Bryobacteraceae bacterium]|jgi:MazG family protein
MSSDPEPTAGDEFQRLTQIMARLRSPEGCPWDREQTFDSIKPYLVEETYEVLDAIDARDWESLQEELGDLLLEAVFFAQMAEEAGLFSITGSLGAISAKLIRRHPHVFGTGDAKTADEVKRRWDEIKAGERQAASQGEAGPSEEGLTEPGLTEAGLTEAGLTETGLLKQVPRALPALAEATQLTSRASGVGFDWDHVDHVLDKLDEELAELAQARAQNAPPERIEEELGDLLFVIVNLARFLKVDPEQALRKTNRKFRRRFGYVERKLKEAGKTTAQATLAEMDALWEEAKRS